MVFGSSPRSARSNAARRSRECKELGSLVVIVTQGCWLLVDWRFDGVFFSGLLGAGAEVGLGFSARLLGFGDLAIEVSFLASTKGALINSISRADSDWEIDLRGMFSRPFRFALIEFLDLAHPTLVQHGWQCLTKHGIDFQGMFLGS